MFSLGFVIDCKFLDLCVSHVRRGGNKPVHILAQYVEGISNSVTWVEGDPIVIESALAQDILNLSSSS